MEVPEGTSRLALGHDGLGHALAHAADAREAKADALRGRREVPARLVDVGRQDVDALAAAGRDVVDDLVGLPHVGREHRRHVLEGEVGLEPSRLHDEYGVAGRVRLVEGIGGKLQDVVPDPLGDLPGVAVVDGTVHPVVVGRLVLAVVPVKDGRGEELDLLLRHGLPDA